MRKKGGRPRLADTEKKTGRMEIKCHPSQKQEITLLAKSHGLSLSEYILRKALGHRVNYNRIHLLNEIHRIGTELSRAGNNINQLAKNANRLNKAGILTQSIVNQMNAVMENYNRQQEQVRVAFRKLIREMNKP